MCINHTLSDPASITSGAVQGSVLGQLLFILFINDIFEHISYGEPFLYADDLKLVYHFKDQSQSTIEDKINSDINNIFLYTQNWLLNLSHDKCFYLNIGNSHNLSLSINGQPISQKNVVRDLGLLYSNTLNFSETVSHNLSRSRYRTGIILRNFSSIDMRHKLFISLVRPLLEFYPFLYNSFLAMDKVKLESPQRYFTSRIITDPIDYHIRCSMLNCHPIWVRMFILSITFMHKLVYKRFFTNLECLIFKPQSYSTRYVSCMLSIRARTTKFRKFFSVNYIFVWNSLPPHIRKVNNFGNFKRLIIAFCNSTLFTSFAIRNGLCPIT